MSDELPPLTRSPVFWAICVAALVVLGVVLANSLGHRKPTDHTVTYSITGTATGVTVVYVDTGEQATTVHDVTLPWSKTLTIQGDPTRYSVRAESGFEASARLACTETIDRKYHVSEHVTRSKPTVICYGARAK